MRLARPEAQRAENARDIRRVIFFEALLRHCAMVHQPLQPKHPDHIRLGFFQPGIRRPDGFANIHLLAVAPRKIRTQLMRNLVHQRE